MGFIKKSVFSFVKVIGKKNIAAVLKFFSLITRKVAYRAHKLQMDFEWKFPPQPEWFDHFCDQYYWFRRDRNPLWAERGLFGLLAMKQGAEVLELCCGDGFNSYHFYSGRAKSIISVDFDKAAIPHAKKYNTAPNATFQLCDIRYDMPEGKFDNIVWDAAIEHFTEKEIDKIMMDLKNRLKKGGVVSGYTLVENHAGPHKALSHHEYEFKSKEDLRRFFEPHFKNVKVFETIYPIRHNLYFFASDEVLPFDQNWEHVTAYNKQ